MEGLAHLSASAPASSQTPPCEDFLTLCLLLEGKIKVNSSPSFILLEGKVKVNSFASHLVTLSHLLAQSSVLRILGQIRTPDVAPKNLQHFISPSCNFSSSTGTF